jgi:hypothetical protein
MLHHSRFTVFIHVLNILIGALSIVILALVVRSVLLTDSLSDIYPGDAKGTGRSILFWPGVGGHVAVHAFVVLDTI